MAPRTAAFPAIGARVLRASLPALCYGATYLLQSRRSALIGHPPVTDAHVVRPLRERSTDGRAPALCAGLVATPRLLGRSLHVHILHGRAAIAGGARMRVVVTIATLLLI